MQRSAPVPDRPAPASSLSPFLAVLCLLCAWMVEGLSRLFGFTTQAADPGSLMVLVAVCAALRLSPTLRASPWLMVPVDTVLAVVAILQFTLIFPWQAQAFALPLVDDQIRRIDLALGFDHVTWMRWLNDHPTVALILEAPYRTLILQVLAIIILCLATGCARHLDRYLGAFVIAIVLTSALSILLPTRGIVAILDPALRGTPGWPQSATDTATYDALRSGALRDLGGIPKLGIISFPSFHAASAALSVWALWHFKGLRLVAIKLNGLMSVATVGRGGHYVVDVLVGHLVASCAILLSVRGSDLGYACVDRMARMVDAIPADAARVMGVAIRLRTSASVSASTVTLQSPPARRS